jgi:serine protease Do
MRYYGPSLILLLAVVLSMLLGPRIARQLIWSGTDARIQQVRAELSGQPSLSELSDAFAKVSEIVEPSVVHIQLRAAGANSGGGWFGAFDSLDVVGNGSGWVYRYQPGPDDDPKLAGNYVVTNHHVVQNAQQVIVRFEDGSEDMAQVIGGDEATDVAVLRIDRDLLHPAAISPTPVEKGQIVFAFGSPFSFDFSVSQGIVSATGRRLPRSPADIVRYQDFIQTDAAINPGNSGGPLADIYGRVVGMNTAIATSRSEPGRQVGFQGIGLAIPVALAVEVADKLIAKGEVRRGYLGVLILDLSDEMASSFGYDGPGVLVEHPLRDGAADAAGLQPGDIIVSVEGSVVERPRDLQAVIARQDPGDRIELRVFRDGDERRLDVDLDRLPTAEDAQAEGPASVIRRPRLSPAPVSDTLLRLGIEQLGWFGPRDARSVGQPAQPGLMVTGLRPRSAADQARITPGSILVAIDGKPIETLENTLTRLESELANGPVRLTLKIWEPSLKQYITRYAMLSTQRQIP